LIIKRKMSGNLSCSAMQGSARLYFGGKTVGAPIAASANGNLVFPPLTISSEVRTGGNTVQISYLGVPGRYAPVQSAVTTVPLNLIPARIQVSARPNPAAVGQPVTFVATITPPPGTPTCPSLQPGCTWYFCSIKLEKPMHRLSRSLGKNVSMIIGAG
jgi:hypothetical protein